MPPVWHALGALLCCGVLAQQVPPSSPASGSIAGTVRSDAGDAVARARVSARPEDGAPPHVAISRNDGTYAIDLPPGRYVVTAVRSGYAATTFGFRQTEPPRPVVVAAGAHVTGIDFSLPREGVIAGRVLDEDGTPLAGARVDALVSRLQSGQHVLDPVATVRADDHGDFRLFGLGPGEYYIAAYDPAFDRVSSGSGQVQYAPTYFPGTSYADEARAVVVRAGATASGVEFAIRLRAPADIRGRIASVTGRKLQSGAVVLDPVEGNGVPAVQDGGITLRPDGTFRIARVPPGRYTIRARGVDRPGGGALFATYRVQMDGLDVDAVELTLRPGSLVAGTVTFDRRHAAPIPTTLHVRAPSPDGGDFGEALTGQVDAHGAFTIRGVMDGEHQLVVEGIEPPWALESIVLRGHDITDELLTAEEGVSFADVRITLVDEASEFSGEVRRDGDRPVPDAGVLVFPVASDRWMRTDRRMRSARTDDRGAFSIYGLPPGAYLAVAAPALDEADLGRPALLERLRPLSTPFSVASSDARVTLTLHVAGLLGPAAPLRPDSR